MTKTKVKMGDGKFQWNFGGWFGALLGGTAYLAIGSFAFAPQHPLLSAIWLICFSATTTFCVRLWMRRETLTPYPALQLMLLACGLSATVAVVSINFMAPNFLANVQLTPIKSVCTLVMFPAMMLNFHLMERSARRKSQPSTRTNRWTDGS